MFRTAMLCVPPEAEAVTLIIVGDDELSLRTPELFVPSEAEAATLIMLGDE
jgi:hypothetical protein